jgi:hypothetical protein
MGKLLTLKTYIDNFPAQQYSTLRHPPDPVQVLYSRRLFPPAIYIVRGGYL